MTGIDRLRTLAGAWDEWGLGGTLAEIADQIERERDVEVADSPYDAIRPEDRDAIAWVRKHGGLDRVKAEWSSRVPRDSYEMMRHRMLDHIAECEAALGRRRRRIEELGKTIEFFQLNNSNFRHLLADVAERLGFTRYGDDYEPEDLLDALDRRLMPEGMEWPTCTDGSPVKLGDCVENRQGVCTVTSVRFYSGGGVTVYGEDSGAQFVVVTEPVMRDPIERVRRPAVPAGDGEPLEVGQTVWDTDAETDTPMTVVDVSSDLIRCEYTWKDGKTYRPCYPPSALTHAKPEIDTWQRIEEDADALVDAEIDGEGSCNAANAYCERRGLGEGTSFVLMAQDLVRRCRALAERDR